MMSSSIGTGAAASRLAALAAVFAGALVAGCAGVGPGQSAGPPVEAPTVRVGDRWVYVAKEGYWAGRTWEEAHEVTAVGSAGITVRVTQKGERLDTVRTETWSAPGVVLVGAVYDAETSRYDPALIRYKYPMQSGGKWNQDVRDLNKPRGPYGPIQRYVRVHGYSKITTPAGTFDAIEMRVVMRLDDEDPFRWETNCNYAIWYAPAVGATVREERRAGYLEKGALDAGGVSTQNVTLELVSFTRGT